VLGLGQPAVHPIADEHPLHGRVRRVDLYLPSSASGTEDLTGDDQVAAAQQAPHQHPEQRLVVAAALPPARPTHVGVVSGPLDAIVGSELAVAGDGDRAGSPQQGPHCKGSMAITPSGIDRPLAAYPRSSSWPEVAKCGEELAKENWVNLPRAPRGRQ
jgi:hypothetical protein